MANTRPLLAMKIRTESGNHCLKYVTYTRNISFKWVFTLSYANKVRLQTDYSLFYNKKKEEKSNYSE